MSLFNRLTAVFMATAMLGPMLPLEAKTRKGDKFYAEAKLHESKKEWDAALDGYRKALEEDPSDILYQMACDRARFQAAQMHVDGARKIRGEGRLGEALLEFQKAYVINPGSIIAGQELAETNQMILRERQRVQQTGKESPPEIRALTPYEEAQRKDAERIGRLLSLPELKPPDPSPIDLHLSGQKTRKIFESIGKLAGINVLFDPEYTEPPSPITVDLQKATVEEALDYVAVITKSYWKALSPNAILVINDNTNKRRDFEEMVTKVFYLQNVTQPTELQEIQQILRTGCEIQRVFQYTAGWALVVRGEADRVELCQKLLRDVDKPKSEVLVDVLVMDATTSFSRQITAAVASTGLNLPVSFTPRSGLQVQSSSSNSSTSTGTSSGTGAGSSTTTGTTTGTTTTSSSSTAGTMVPLANLGHISSADFATTLPGALLQAALSDSRTRVLQAPQIRAVDNVKSTMNIGERVPVATGSYTPGATGVGVSSLVNTQFSYQDVGVNVELLARVVGNDEIYMHLKLDVSQIDGYQSQGADSSGSGGVSEPIFGQRKIEQELRVKEGEVALIGGVTKQQDDVTVTGIPGLSKIPILGKLFSGKTADRNTDEMMVVLIPHIIRRPEYTPDNLRAIAVGTAQSISLRHSPKPLEIAVDGQIPARVEYTPLAPGAASASPFPAPPANALAAMAPPATAPPATAPAAMAPLVTAPPATALPAMAPPAAAPPANPPAAIGPPATAPLAAAPAAMAPPAARVRFNPLQMETGVNSVAAVSVVLEGGQDVSSAPMMIRFDPKMLRLNDVTAGEFLASDGQAPALNKNIQNDLGTATLVLNRPPGLPGVSSPAGVLVKLSFQTLGRGSTTVAIPSISVRDSQGQPIATGNPADLTIGIR
jgi:general secretion pathway protein D